MLNFVCIYLNQLCRFCGKSLLVEVAPTDNPMASILLKGGGNPCDFLTLLRSHISGNYVTVQARFADGGESEKLRIVIIYSNLEVSQYPYFNLCACD